LSFLAYGYEGVEGYLNLFAGSPRCYEIVRSFPTDDLPAVIPFVTDLGDSMNLFFGAATRQRPLWNARGGGEDCLLLPFLFADLDVEDPARHQTDKRYPANRAAALAFIECFPLPPTVIVWTGGGVHVYWKLAPALSIPDAEPLLARLKVTAFRLAAEHGVDIDHIFEVARMMRLPGSVNHKATPVLVEVIFSDWTRTYSARDWEVVLDELPAPPPPKPARSRPPLRLRGSQDSEWPERDGFNASHSVHDVLFEAGWSVHRETADKVEYIRPDKTTEGNSATVYAHEPQRVVVWTDAGGVPGMRGFDAWGLHVHLHFHGDFNAATRDGRLQRFGRWQQRATSRRGGLHLRSGL
jgi:putative DNA primase/helicase